MAPSSPYQKLSVTLTSKGGILLLDLQELALRSGPLWLPLRAGLCVVPPAGPVPVRPGSARTSHISYSIGYVICVYIYICMFRCILCYILYVKYLVLCFIFSKKYIRSEKLS